MHSVRPDQNNGSRALKLSQVIEGALPDKPLPDGKASGGQRKIDSIQLLRGMAALSVVFYHLWLLEKKYSPGSTLLPGFCNAGRSGVDLFFVISGFIMVLITRKKWGGENNSLNFLLHRFARIYPNYWFYFFLTLGVFLVQPSFVNASQGGRFSFLDSLLLFPSTSLPLVMVAWSLIYELYFYLLFALLMRCTERKVVLLMAAWMLFLIVINLFPIRGLSPLMQVILSPYSIEFICGAFAALVIGHPWVRKLPDSLLYLLVGTVIIAVPVLFPYLYANGAFTGRRLLIQALVFGTLFTLLVICMATIEGNKQIRFPKALVILGDISFTVYLCQLLIMGAMSRIWSAFFLRPGWLDNALFIGSTVCVIVVYSYFAHRIIEKPSYTFVIGRLIRRRKAAAKA